MWSLVWEEILELGEHSCARSSFHCSPLPHLPTRDRIRNKCVGSRHFTDLYSDVHHLVIACLKTIFSFSKSETMENVGLFSRYPTQGSKFKEPLKINLAFPNSMNNTLYISEWYNMYVLVQFRTILYG